MRKEAKKKIENFINILPTVNECIKEKLSIDIQQVKTLLKDSWEGMNRIYDMVIESEKNTCNNKILKTIQKYQECLKNIDTLLEEEKQDVAKEFCNQLFLLWDELSISVAQIKIKLEIVFMPYKAAMWDSLESVWIEANADTNCDAYVVPIPYYDKNLDGTFGELHYEGDLFPKEVPILHYNDYIFEERKPDVIYIHNPYDWANNVTSIDPRFYSNKLKKHTNCLVYIPYYSTTGGMAEAQEKCLAYYNVDYIVIQSEKFRKYFDLELPDEKFLTFGSPKFDRVIRICSNPPKPPREWAKKIQGRKVYFYNTSLGGMLADTERFLKKMEYVFDTFRERKDVCILWRPHPLFESTIDTMRKEFRPAYDKLKEKFLKDDFGIYDITPDITNTIALCDAYIGDSGTSVTSLFGVVGKPMFILNNNIHHLPKEDDWRGEIIKGFYEDVDNNWKVTQGNKLYHAKKLDYRYRYVCDLCEYAGGNYFGDVITIGKRSYVYPINAQEIVVIENEQIIDRVLLKPELEKQGAFCSAIAIGQYLYLIPRNYPAIVRYHVEKKNVEYISGYNQYFVKIINGEWRVGGFCEWNNYLLIASPNDNVVLAIDNRTGMVQLLSTGANHACGCISIVPDQKDVWLLPFTGRIITKWNPLNGKRKEYSNLPKEFICKNRPYGFLCEDRPFFWAVFDEKYVYFSPLWGNMFVRLNKKSGKMEEWKLPIFNEEKPKSDYYNYSFCGYLINEIENLNKRNIQYFSLYNAKLYNINLKTKVYKEIPIKYDIAELKENTSGFCEDSDWLKYCCIENSFHTLNDFLDDSLPGNVFEKEKQIHSYEKINASCNGDCGKKVHEFIKKCSLPII